jgi:hypothetical protein
MVVLSSGEAAACGDVESFEEEADDDDDSKSEPYELVFEAGDPTSEGSMPSMALISAALPTLTLSMLMLESKLRPEDESMVLEMRLEAPPPPPPPSPIEEPKAPKKSYGDWLRSVGSKALTSSSRKLKKLGVGLPPSFTPMSGKAAAGGACGGVSRWGVLSREPEEVEGEEEEAPDEGSEKSSVLKMSL